MLTTEEYIKRNICQTVTTSFVPSNSPSEDEDDYTNLACW